MGRCLLTVYYDMETWVLLCERGEGRGSRRGRLMAVPNTIQQHCTVRILFSYCSVQLCPDVIDFRGQRRPSDTTPGLSPFNWALQPTWVLLKNVCDR